MPGTEQTVSTTLCIRATDLSLPLTRGGQFNDLQVDVGLVEATVDPKAAACGVDIPGKYALRSPRAIRKRKKHEISWLLCMTRTESPPSHGGARR